MSADSEVTKLLSIMQEMLIAVRTVCSNQEKLSAEQQHLAKAMGEVGLLLKNQGAAITRLWHEAGLAVDESEIPPVTN